MPTLYISDLDGTLLNQNAELSKTTIDTLNYLIDNSISISVATARTAATCDSILSSVKLNVPIILMNGVLIYDFGQKKYIKKEILSNEAVSKIQNAMKKTGLTGLMYGLTDDKLLTYYEYIPNSQIKEFIDERADKYNKKFIRVENFNKVNGEIIYFCFIDSHENIHRLFNEIQDIENIHIEKYEDIYTSDNSWYMEVFSDSASKYNAVTFLRQRYGYDHIVAFGDNLNDIPMFDASDKCYAVANAKQAVKLKADGIIGKNTEDSVVKEIQKLEKL